MRARWRAWICAGLLLAATAVGAAPTNSWYVALSGSGAGGTNWATAFPTVEAAFAAATQQNDIIYLAGGVYLQTNQLVWSNVTLRIYGGYQGSGAPGTRDPAAWPTVWARPASATNRILLINQVNDGVLSGVVISNGFAYGVHPAGSGGGLYINASTNVLLENCQVVTNRIRHDTLNGGDIYGAGLYAINSRLTISNCLFFRNYGQTISVSTHARANGGGMCVVAGEVTVRDSQFLQNTLQSDYGVGFSRGAGLYVNGTGDVGRAVFRGNRCWSGANRLGDGLFLAGGRHTVRQTLFLDGQYHGVYQEGASTRTLLENCTIVSNGTNGIRLAAGTLVASNCIVWGHADDIAGTPDLFYCAIQDGTGSGANGNVATDPEFADTLWYHLRSRTGYYQGGYFSGGSWTSAPVHSALIDAADPLIRPTDEPLPNGGIVNLGAYGNTEVASRSLPLAVSNRAAVSIGSTFGTLQGRLEQVGTPDVALRFYYGLSDGGTNPLAWGGTVGVATVSAPGDFSAVVTGLVNGAPYYYTAFASNDAGEIAWGTPSTSFVPRLSVPVVINTGVENESGPSVTLRGRVTSTGGEAPEVFICWGPAEGTTATGSWQRVEALGTQTGDFQTVVATLAGSNYFYTCQARNSTGTAWATPFLPFGAQRIRYVDVGATGAGTGYNWSNALTTIQAALDQCREDWTNLIYVKGGIYEVATPLSWTQSHVRLYGGCAGDGVPGSRNPAAQPTVIANPLGMIRLATLTDVSDGILDGVELEGGRPTDSGGGIWLSGVTHLTITNCVFRNHVATGNGGGIYIAGSSNVTLAGCTWISNRAANAGTSRYGGGVYAVNSYGLITHGHFERNFVQSGSQNHGAGLYFSGGAWTVQHTRLVYNWGSGTSLGGGLFSAGGNHLLNNCLIAQNDMGSGSDGVYVGGGTLTLRNCTVAANGGQGVRQNSGAISIMDSILWKNGDDVVGTVTLNYSNVEDGDQAGSNGCFSADPAFERGFYLAPHSPCVNTGSQTAADAGLAGRTTRADGTADSEAVDLGWHDEGGLDPAIADFYVAPDGQDTWSGTNASQPFRTLTKAATVAREGSRIHIAAGSYTNGTEAFPLRFVRYGIELLGTNRATTHHQAPGNPAQVRLLEMTDASFGRIQGLTFSGAYLYGNWDGGAVTLQNAAGIEVVDCVFSNNYLANSGNATTRGAGLFAGGNSYGVMSNCVAVQNTCYHAGGSTRGDTLGAGVALVSGEWLIVNSTFRNNYAYCNSIDFGRGAGLYLAGGPHIVRNSLIVSNNVAAGGYSSGVFGDGVGLAAGAQAELVNCNILNNLGQGVHRPAGAGSLSLVNCILWGNGDDVTGSVSLAYCLVEDGDQDGVEGCFSEEPYFEDFHAGDYRLMKRSPCIDAGTNQIWMFTAFDVNGRERIKNGVVDVGYLEALKVEQGIVVRFY